MTITDHPQMADALRRAGFKRVIDTQIVDGVITRTVSWVGRPAGESEEIILPDDLDQWNKGKPPEVKP